MSKTINWHVFWKNKLVKFASSSDGKNPYICGTRIKIKAKFEAVRGPTSISTRFILTPRLHFKQGGRGMAEVLSWPITYFKKSTIHPSLKIRKKFSGPLEKHIKWAWAKNPFRKAKFLLRRRCADTPKRGGGGRQKSANTPAHSGTPPPLHGESDRT